MSLDSMIDFYSLGLTSKFNILDLFGGVGIQNRMPMCRYILVRAYVN